MATLDTTYNRLVTELCWRDAVGLVESEAVVLGARGEIFRRLRRVLPDVSAVYFCEDEPLVYIARLEAADPAKLVDLHRRVWNDARVPLLFVVTPTEVRVYDASAVPTKDPDGANEESRLIRKLSATASFLEGFPLFKREALDTGTYTMPDSKHFSSETRCDSTLLKNLQILRRKLGKEVGLGLNDDVIHPLLLRSMLLLHLEHRDVIPQEYFEKFLPSARAFTDLLTKKSATFDFFDDMAKEFNGDLFPLSPEERRTIRIEHLALLRDFLCGRIEMEKDQYTLWPMYDFSIIPIQVVSALYKVLLHTAEAEGRDVGAFYTRPALVELVMNEVLPWPSRDRPRLAELPRIVDPACGSGVFLVEAFRRLIAHERVRLDRQPSQKELVKLIAEHIYGTDLNESAVKVAAFSLYLALLDELSPIEVWSELTFPTLTKADGVRRANLVNADAFDAFANDERTFDIVVGNPPWLRAKIPPSAKKYCADRLLPVAQELACPFMWLASEILDKGRAALVCPSKWLTNGEVNDDAFRTTFFSAVDVETIVNLSAIRRTLFDDAVGPAAIVVFRRRSAAVAPTVLYVAPKPSATAIPLGLLIDSGDMQWIPRQLAETEPRVWSALQEGSRRDFDLVRRLATQHTLLQFIEAGEEKGWVSKRGFQPNGPHESPEVLGRLPFVQTKWIDRPVLMVAEDGAPTRYVNFKRLGDTPIYRAPHVLVRKGLSDARGFASYVDVDCTFQDAVLAIHGPPEDKHRVKAISAYFHSTFARYWLSLVISTAGTDWKYMSKEERLSLPVRPIAENEYAKHLAEIIDSISSESDYKPEIYVPRIDEIVYEALGLTAHERSLVESQKALTSIPTINVDMLASRYAKTFLEIFRPLHLSGSWPGEATVHTGQAPLRTVSFKLLPRKQRTGQMAIKTSPDLDAVLTHLDRVLVERESANIFRRRHLRLFETDVMHVVKPNEARFWTTAAAHEDAHALLGDAISPKGPHVPS